MSTISLPALRLLNIASTPTNSAALCARCFWFFGFFVLFLTIKLTHKRRIFILNRALGTACIQHYCSACWLVLGFNPALAHHGDVPSESDGDPNGRLVPSAASAFTASGTFLATVPLCRWTRVVHASRVTQLLGAPPDVLTVRLSLTTVLATNHGQATCHGEPWQAGRSNTHTIAVCYHSASFCLMTERKVPASVEAGLWPH